MTVIFYKFTRWNDILKMSLQITFILFFYTIFIINASIFNRLNGRFRNEHTKLRLIVVEWLEIDWVELNQPSWTLNSTLALYIYFILWGQ